MPGRRAGPSPSLLRRDPAGTPGDRPPGGLLPVAGLRRLPDVPGLGPPRGCPGEAERDADRNELAGLARPGRGQERPSRPDDGDEDDRVDDGFAAGFDTPDEVRPGDLPPARSKSRDWAAPPAWVAGSDDDEGADAPAFLADAGGRDAAGRGAAGTGAAAAAGLAGSRWLNEARSKPADDPDLADLDRSLEADRAARHAREPAARHEPDMSAEDIDDDDAIRPVASAVASPGRRANQVSRRPTSTDRESGRPAWERSRRNEAYPTLKTRIGMPPIPRSALALGALVIAAIVMISLPFLLNPVALRALSRRLSRSRHSAVAFVLWRAVGSGPAAPSPQVYTVVSGDTITKIAKRFSMTTAQLLAANPQIKNANSIKSGDKITIPRGPPAE